MEIAFFSTASWDDEWVRSLTETQQRVWFYLLTSPDRDYCFLRYNKSLFAYRLTTPDHLMQISEVEATILKFQQDGKITLESDMIYLNNWFLHNHLSDRDLDKASRGLARRYSRFPKLVSLSESVIDGLRQTESDGVGRAKEKKRKEEKKILPPTPLDEKPARVKPESKSLSEVLAELPAECHSAWNQFAAMVASHNTSGTVADTRLAGLLQDVITRTQGQSPGAISAGLIAACLADDGRGVPNTRYVAKAAAGYRADSRQQTRVSQSDLDEMLQREAMGG